MIGSDELIESIGEKDADEITGLVGSNEELASAAKLEYSGIASDELRFLELFVNK